MTDSTNLVNDSDREPPAPTAGIRWWPLVVISILATVAIGWTRLLLDIDHQSANLRSIAIGLLFGGLALVWLLLFSRLSGRHRIRAGAIALLVIGALAASIRIRGVTGDLLPVFEWRWGNARPLVVETPRSADDEPSAPIDGLADYPQFFGPARNGKLEGPELARDWGARPPTELWRHRVGAAWSGFAVAGRRAITQEQHGEDESVVCYDVPTGDVLWIHRDLAHYENALAGEGPRATPTIVGDRVFAQGATGILNCLELATGKRVWSTHVLDDNGAALPEWGVAGSPLWLDGKIIVNAGGPNDRSLAAYDATSGSFAWGGGSDVAHWSSPIRATLAGVEQILMFGPTVVAHHAGTGAVLWRHDWKGGHPHVSMPVPLEGDRVLVSSGYGTGSQLLQIESGPEGELAATREWRSLRLKAKFANLIAKDGFVYGLDDGTMVCVDLTDGKRRWKGGRYGHGQMILVGDLLLVTSEDGNVVLLEPVPDEPRELTRFEAFDDKTWNPPALAGEYLLIRNDLEAACYRLPVQQHR